VKERGRGGRRGGVEGGGEEGGNKEGRKKGGEEGREEGRKESIIGFSLSRYHNQSPLELCDHLTGKDNLILKKHFF
jgi:hypothetical protein